MGKARRRQTAFVIQPQPSCPAAMPWPLGTRGTCPLRPALAGPVPAALLSPFQVAAGQVCAAVQRVCAAGQPGAAGLPAGRAARGPEPHHRQAVHRGQGLGWPPRRGGGRRGEARMGQGGGLGGVGYSKQRRCQQSGECEQAGLHPHLPSELPPPKRAHTHPTPPCAHAGLAQLPAPQRQRDCGCLPVPVPLQADLPALPVPVGQV